MKYWIVLFGVIVMAAQFRLLPALINDIVLILWNDLPLVLKIIFALVQIVAAIAIVQEIRKKLSGPGGGRREIHHHHYR